jgi:hypothetical protein
MTKIVRKSLSDSPMTARRKSRLAKLAKRPDSAIDFSDVPELTGQFWENAVRNPFYRPVTCRSQKITSAEVETEGVLTRRSECYIRLKSPE